MKKSFILDTSVLLHNAAALFSFADNEVVIPLDVLEELDHFKGENSDTGRHAREVVRQLDGLRRKGKISEGVPLNETGGTLRVAMAPVDVSRAGFTANTVDNRIITTAFEVKRLGHPVILVSKDINVRIKADTVGIDAMDFEKQKVNYEELYQGWEKREIAGDLIDTLYKSKAVDFDGDGLFANEFLLLVDSANPKHSAVGRLDGAARKLTLALGGADSPVYGISGRNLQQRMALEILLDPAVELVTLLGEAGTGKTLLALAAGLHMTAEKKRYDKLLVCRPIMPLGKDIGFLPGSKEEKLHEWMGPIFDNLNYIFHVRKGAEVSGERQIKRLQDANLLELEVLTYIRGRSIPRQYMVVDEAQNLTPLEVKTIISRAGEGTKVVLTGDATQIDNPYLDSNSNGLSYTVERMKGQPLFGHVLLDKSERSTLASVAAELL